MKRLLLTIAIIILTAGMAHAGFCGYIRADTQTIVTIGPFVDVGDGFTPQTDITLGGDEAELLKHGSTSVVDISGATWAAVANCRGSYSLTLTTSHTDTEGMLTVVVQDDSDCLPVRCDFEVVDEIIYDSLFKVAATDYLPVDNVQLGGGSQSLTDLKDFADAGYDPTNDRVVKVYQLTELDEDNTTLDLDGTTIGTVSTLTGHTAQTGDTYAALPTNFSDLLITVTAGLISLAADQSGVTIGTVTTNTDMRGTDGANTTVPDAAGTLAIYDPPTKTEMDAAFTEIKGATFSADSDQLEDLRDRGDSAWITATSTTVSDKTGFSLSAGGIDEILDDIIEGTLTTRTILRILLAKETGKTEGAGTATIKFRDLADTKYRIQGTITSGNRTSVTLDGS